MVRPISHQGEDHIRMLLQNNCSGPQQILNAFFRREPRHCANDDFVFAQFTTQRGARCLECREINTIINDGDSGAGNTGIAQQIRY